MFFIYKKGKNKNVTNRTKKLRDFVESEKKLKNGQKFFKRVFTNCNLCVILVGKLIHFNFINKNTKGSG